MMLQSLFAFAYKVKRTFLRPENPLSFEAHPNRRVFLLLFFDVLVSRCFLVECRNNSSKVCLFVAICRFLK